MAQAKKKKVVLVRGVVVEGKDREALDVVTIDRADANYLISSKSAVDPSTDEGKEAIAELEKAQKAKKSTKRARKAPTQEPNPPADPAE